jgi:thymidine kinase
MTERPLTDEEIQELRRILDEEGKRQWLWTLMRKSAAWVFGAAAALVTFRDDISALIAWIVGR